LVGLVCTAALAPAPSDAHPHVFVDAAVSFVIDTDGRLSGARISHFYDPLVSLFVLQDLGIDPFDPLGVVDTRTLVDAQRVLLTEANGFAELTVDAVEATFGPIEDLEATMDGERLRVDFTLPLAAPVALDGEAARLAIYDPVYFIAFDLGERVDVEGTDRCRAEALEWRPSERVLALQATLLDLPADATPEDATVGRLFAAEARLTCP
jgi:ABC-type uncharacterized transport system substrate-binding protein